MEPRDLRVPPSAQRTRFQLRRPSDSDRIEVLLLLVALATLVLWLVGLAGRAKDLARRLQANTVSHRLVLSTPFVAGSCSSGVSPNSHLPYSSNLLLSFEPSSLSPDSLDFVGIPQKPELGGLR